MDRIENFIALKELIKNTKTTWANGIFSFGNPGARISVDTIKNEVFKEDTSASWSQIALGKKKSNGYLYAPVNLDGQDCLIGIHTIVCMLTNGLPCDYMVANHKNNCHWDNAPANLEWVTGSENNLHGRVVKSLEKHFPGEYTHIEKRGSKDHIILNNPLSIDDILRYLAYKPARYFSVKKVEGYISPDKIEDFVAWMGW